MPSGERKPLRKNEKIRLKRPAEPWFFGAGQCLSRQEALSRIQACLSKAALHPEALRLIDLFQIDPEELSERGLSYEALKALESRALFF